MTDAYKERMLGKALAQLRSAIELLDRASAPGYIAAHIDFAVHQLECALSVDSPPDGPESDFELYGVN